MKHSFKTENTCSKKIEFEIVDHRIKNVQFHSGCDGNLKAMAILVENMEVNEVVSKLRGIQCGKNATSCGDQLSKAIEKALQETEAVEEC